LLEKMERIKKNKIIIKNIGGPPLDFLLFFGFLFLKVPFKT